MEPVSLKRVLFWCLYVLGSLFLVLRFLLSLVPGGVRDFRMFLFYFGADVIPASLFLACYLLCKHIMDARNWDNDGVPSRAYNVFGFLTSVQLAFCLLRVGGMMFYFIFKLK